MKRVRAAASRLVPLLALCGCATNERPSPAATAFAEAIPVCSLLANPASYVGKRVLVRGYLTSNPHGREFLGEGCERRMLPLNIDQDWPPETAEARRLRKKFQAYADWSRGPPWVPAVYSGIVKDHGPAIIAWAGHLSLQDAELVALGRPMRR